MTSLKGELQEIIISNNAGIFYESGKPDQLAAQFLGYVNNPDELARQASNARSLWGNNFDSREIYPQMADWLCSLVAHPTSEGHRSPER